MRLILDIHRVKDLDTSSRHRLVLHHLWVRVRFQLPSGGWSDDHFAIVDTGAPYSVIPISLWPRLRLTRLQESSLRGIVPGEAAELDSTLARVPVQLLDDRYVSRRFHLNAMLVKTDHIPLIIGWSGCLDRVKLVVDNPHHRAWLEV